MRNPNWRNGKSRFELAKRVPPCNLFINRSLHTFTDGLHFVRTLGINVVNKSRIDSSLFRKTLKTHHGWCELFTWFEERINFIFFKRCLRYNSGRRSCLRSSGKQTTHRWLEKKNRKYYIQNRRIFPFDCKSLSRLQTFNRTPGLSYILDRHFELGNARRKWTSILVVLKIL